LNYEFIQLSEVPFLKFLGGKEQGARGKRIEIKEKNYNNLGIEEKESTSV